jgi:hypothetical protein
MINDLTHNTNGSAIATGLVVSALIDCLIEKGVLTRSDASSALWKARDMLGLETTTPDRIAAARVIGAFLRHVSQG